MKKVLNAQEVEQLKDISAKMVEMRNIISNCYQALDDLKTQAYDVSYNAEFLETEEGFICGFTPTYIEESVVPASHIHYTYPDLYMKLNELGLIIQARKGLTFKVGKK